MRDRFMRGVCGAVLVIGVLLMVAASASAEEFKPFGITRFTMQTTGPTKEEFLGEPHPGQKEYEFVNEPDGFTQAGGHPWALTTTGEFASEEVEFNEKGLKIDKELVPTQDPKDVVVSLPPGLLGDPVAVPRCSLALGEGKGESCPASTQVGVFRLRWEGSKEILGPIVNVVPEAGQSAEFALQPQKGGISTVLTAHLVRTPQGYGFTVVTKQHSGDLARPFRIDFLGCARRPRTPTWR